MNRSARIDVVQNRACVNLPNRNESVKTTGGEKAAKGIESHGSYDTLVEGSFIPFLVPEYRRSHINKGDRGALHNPGPAGNPGRKSIGARWAKHRSGTRQYHFRSAMAKVHVCLCTSHGCADAERKSKVTGQILKGTYLGELEYRSHQRHEKALKLAASGSGSPCEQTSLSCSSKPSIPEPLLNSIVPQPSTEILCQLPSTDVLSESLDQTSPAAPATQPQPSVDFFGESLCSSQSIDVCPTLSTCSTTNLQVV